MIVTGKNTPSIHFGIRSSPSSFTTERERACLRLPKLAAQAPSSCRILTSRLTAHSPLQSFVDWLGMGKPQHSTSPLASLAMPPSVAKRRLTLSSTLTLSIKCEQECPLCPRFLPLYLQQPTFSWQSLTSGFDPACVKTSTALFMLPMILLCFGGRI